MEAKTKRKLGKILLATIFILMWAFNIYMFAFQIPLIITIGFIVALALCGLIGFGIFKLLSAKDEN